MNRNYKKRKFNQIISFNRNIKNEEEEDYIDEEVHTHTHRIINNHIYFYSDVNDKTIYNLIKDLQLIDNKMQNIKETCDVQDVKIHLHINSGGGDIFGAFAVIDKILNCKTPVYTYVEGTAASAATLISIVGKKRFITKHSYMLIHQLSSEFWGKFAEITDEMKNLTKFMTDIKKIYEKYCKVPKNKLNDILKHDIWWSSQECKKYGLIDNII